MKILKRKSSTPQSHRDRERVTNNNVERIPVLKRKVGVRALSLSLYLSLLFSFFCASFVLFLRCKTFRFPLIITVSLSSSDNALFLSLSLSLFLSTNRCWKTTIKPNAPLKMHRHDRFRVIVALQGGVLKKTEEDGSQSDLVFETGKAYYLPPDPPNELHADINEGSEDVVVMVCEFKNEGEPATGAKTCSCGDGVECSCPKFTGFRLEGNRASDNWQPPTTKRDG